MLVLKLIYISKGVPDARMISYNFVWQVHICIYMYIYIYEIINTNENSEEFTYN